MLFSNIRSFRFKVALLGVLLFATMGWGTRNVYAGPSVAALKKQARTGTSAQQIKALKLLVKKGKVALEPLGQALLKGNYLVRAAAVKLIVRFGADANPTLKHVMLKGGSSATNAALEVVQKLGPKAAPLMPILHAFLKLYNTSIQEQLVQSYAALGKIAVRPMYLGVMKGSTKLQIGSLMVLKHMGKIGVPALVKIIEKGAPSNQKDAACLLVTLGQKEAKLAMPTLLKILKDDKSTMHHEVLLAIGKSGTAGEAAVPAILAYLEGKKGRKAIAALQTLGSLGLHASSALTVLVKWISKKSRLESFAATSAIAKMGRKGLRALDRQLSSTDVGVVCAVIDGLKTLKKGVRPMLKSFHLLLNHKSHLVRYRAADVVGLLGDASSYQRILALSNSETNTGVLSSLIKALSLLKPKDPRTAKRVWKAFFSKDRLVRYYAGFALARTGDSAIPTFIELLKRDDVQDKRYLLDRLAKFGSKARAALPVIKTFLNNKNHYTRHTARKAIDKIK